jgi:hypothetical protein
MGIAYNPKIVTDGLVLCLDAANQKSYPGSGTTWNDLSGNGNNGTLVNGVGYSADNKGIMVFDGANDTVDCGPTPQINSSLTQLTVSIWVYPTISATKCIMENGTNHSTNTFYMFQENSNYFTFEVYGTNYDIVYANYIYQLNTWYNLVGVWTADNRVDLYTNGTLTSGTRGGVVQSSVRNGNTNMFVGSRAGISYFNSGNISQPMLYNIALSAKQINQNFNATRGRYGI